MSQVWVAGEALIDLISRADSQEAVVGGGPANTAKALAQLGIASCFIGGISSDHYGAMIEAELVSCGTDLSLALRSDLPSAIALVEIDPSGLPKYQFKLDETATFDFRADWLPSGRPDAIYLGTLATIIQPGANALFDWASEIGAPIIFDPNIRPAVLSDRGRYRAAVERFAAISTVVKLSVEDLGWLGYESLDDFFELGVELVVVTEGEVGITGYTPAGRISVPAQSVSVIDTVGAGDTVGAILVEGLLKYGLAELSGANLFAVLSRAAKAAAITCSRAGAKPPTLAELD